MMPFRISNTFVEVDEHASYNEESDSEDVLVPCVRQQTAPARTSLSVMFPEKDNVGESDSEQQSHSQTDEEEIGRAVMEELPTRQISTRGCSFLSEVSDEQESWRRLTTADAFDNYNGKGELPVAHLPHTAAALDENPYACSTTGMPVFVPAVALPMPVFTNPVLPEEAVVAAIGSGASAGGDCTLDALPPRRAPGARRQRGRNSLIDIAKQRLRQEQQSVVDGNPSGPYTAEVVLNFCPYCGAKAAVSFRFCQFCGASLSHVTGEGAKQ
eukprot:CAMPEP_0172725198 /NCGR_PEP_ID=MMETSP1074-20121228/87815_1 /TAXON_ID=2916 /ORGANISM="Ceratium fusus, Strain PA161109" /LENGTH=269 /DNA_ID=CAMNT_0013551915 /DNA_START=48 /DNA_END=857 /DNA_ORIENTATION=+